MVQAEKFIQQVHFNCDKYIKFILRSIFSVKDILVKIIFLVNSFSG